MKTQPLPDYMIGCAAPRYYRHAEWPRSDAVRIARLRQASHAAMAAWNTACNQPSPLSSTRERAMRRYYRAEARLGLAKSHAAYVESGALP